MAAPPSAVLRSRSHSVRMGSLSGHSGVVAFDDSTISSSIRNQDYTPPPIHIHTVCVFYFFPLFSSII